MGLSNDMHDIDGSRKTADINYELLRQSVDIAALQKTRLADSGTLKEKFIRKIIRKSTTPSSGRENTLMSQESTV